MLQVAYIGLVESCWLGWVSDKAGQHIGSAIHLPPDQPAKQPSGYNMISSPLVPQQSNVAYWGPNEGKAEENYGPTFNDLAFFANSMGSSIHWVETGYLPKLKALMNGPFPIDVSGYIDGTRCTGDAECSSKACVGNTCGLASAGESCSEHSDCESGHACDWQISIMSSTCVPKAENGAWCDEGEDCISGNCSSFYGCY